ncbi:MAG: hypothetical protein IPL26_18785 [Leptospiraceae bacterium]|nr:hypothetical protein [Leptospiraceae bacterium]
MNKILECLQRVFKALVSLLLILSCSRWNLRDRYYYKLSKTTAPEKTLRIILMPPLKLLDIDGEEDLKIYHETGFPLNDDNIPTEVFIAPGPHSIGTSLKITNAEGVDYKHDYIKIPRNGNESVIICFTVHRKYFYPRYPIIRDFDFNSSSENSVKKECENTPVPFH